jgi:hypothetical protein
MDDASKNKAKEKVNILIKYIIQKKKMIVL